MNPLDQLANARENFGFNRQNKEHHRRLKYVLAQTGEKRWRAAHDFYLWLNPSSKVVDPETGVLVKTVDARTASRIVQAGARAQMKQLELEGNPMGKTKDKNAGMRWGFSMPPGLLSFLEMIGLELGVGTPENRKRDMHEVMRALPEYKVASRV